VLSKALNDNEIISMEREKIIKFFYRNIKKKYFYINRSNYKFCLFAKILNVLIQYSLNFCLDLSMKNKKILIRASDFDETLEDYIRFIYVINREILILVIKPLKKYFTEKEK
jgi:hypothetical protein